MTGVKVIDRDTRAPCRRARLWECFGRVGVNPTDLKDAKGAFYAIVQTDMVEQLLTREVKTTFMEQGFEIMAPIKFHALRSVMVKHIDRVINEYTEEEIIQSIDDKNNWANVESIYNITNTGRLL